MKRQTPMTSGAALCLLGLSFGACSDTTPSTGREGARLEIAVAPLTLTGVTNACYRITVENGLSETVWQRGTVCADDFGDGTGAVTYVGPCDAQAAANVVRLELEDLYDASGVIDRDTYQNPCGHADNGNDDGFAACAQPFTCRENQDVLVPFDVTVMRDAVQGFFDIAVDFEDIFCSAKMDCRYGTDPITLLHHPVSGQRGQTGVIALACTSGAGDTADTVLHMGPVEVTCGANTIVLDPTAGPGNAYTTSSPDPNTGDAVWQYAVYRGIEDLDCGETECNKLYWNIAIGFDPTAAGCSVKASATASTFAGMTDGQTPASATYPWIDFDVQLTGQAGGLVCSQNPLNGEGSGVSTTYTQVTAQKRFCHRFDGATASTVDHPDCATAIDLTPFRKDLDNLDELGRAFEKRVLDFELAFQEATMLRQQEIEALTAHIAEQQQTLAERESDLATLVADREATQRALADTDDAIANEQNRLQQLNELRAQRQEELADATANHDAAWQSHMELNALIEARGDELDPLNWPAQDQAIDTKLQDMVAAGFIASGDADTMSAALAAEDMAAVATMAADWRAAEQQAFDQLASTLTMLIADLTAMIEQTQVKIAQLDALKNELQAELAQTTEQLQFTQAQIQALLVSIQDDQQRIQQLVEGPVGFDQAEDQQIEEIAQLFDVEAASLRNQLEALGPIQEVIDMLDELTNLEDAKRQREQLWQQVRQQAGDSNQPS